MPRHEIHAAQEPMQVAPQLGFWEILFHAMA
jgi:hypothetical protein